MFRLKWFTAPWSRSGTMPEPVKAVGATPAGATDEHSAATAVQRMFDEIAPRYAFLNHALSMNVDRLWWRRTARIFRHILARDTASVIELCPGTGRMPVALLHMATGPRIYVTT